MYDDFRNAVSEEKFEGDEGNANIAPFSFPDGEEFPEETVVEASRRRLPRLRVPREVMGMTPFQNFMIALLLLLMVVVGGILFLLITEKMVIF